MPPTPRRGQRVLAGVVALAMFGGAVALASGAFRGSPPAFTAPDDAAVLRLVAGDLDPEMSLSYGGRSAASFTNSYCWNQSNGPQKCADVVPPSPFPADAFLPVTVGTTFVIENPDGADPVTLTIGPGVDPTTVPESPTAIEDLSSLDPGRYVLSVVATWDGRGSNITTYFALEMVDEGAADDVLVATMRAPADGSVPELSLEYRGEEASFPGAGRWNDEPVAVVMMLFVFEPRLEPGAAIRIEGDATSVDVALRGHFPDGRPLPTATPIDVSSGEGVLPRQAGGYLLEVTGRWPNGHVGYSVAVTIGHADEPEPSPLPPVTENVVPDLVGLGLGDAEKLLEQAGLQVRLVVRPIADVAAGLVASTDPAPGTRLDPGSVVELRVSGTHFPLDGYLTGLACSSEDMMPFGKIPDVIGGGDEALIRSNVVGLRDRDVLTRAEGIAATYQLSRDSRALAVIHVEGPIDVQGESIHLPTIEGIACRGSGIGGV
jgi:hypothetical protein